MRTIEWIRAWPGVDGPLEVQVTEQTARDQIYNPATAQMLTITEDSHPESFAAYLALLSCLQAELGLS